jgi:hypothetical protein
MKKGTFDVYRIQRSHFTLACRAPGARAPDHPRTGSGARVRLPRFRRVREEKSGKLYEGGDYGKT